jgi:hypothetical protein
MLKEKFVTLMNKVSKNQNSIFNTLSIILIGIFLIGMLCWVCINPTVPMGESDDYMIAAISLEKRLSLRITHEDVLQAAIDYPEHYNDIKVNEEAGAFFRGKDGGIYPWYFGTYSFLCIPVKKLLKLMHLSQSYAFVISNVIFYVIALLFVFYKLKADRKIVFIVILLLVCNPAVAYLRWPSAEVLLFSFVTMSAISLVNRDHFLSAIFASLAGSLNVTILFFGVCIILDYFLLLQKRERSWNIIKICLNNIKNISLLACCFLPAIISLAFNYSISGHLVLQMGSSRTEKWFGRFAAYIFDLNFGFLPYFTIPLLLFLVLFIFGIMKRDQLSMIFCASFVSVVLAYARHWHINCGMSGIARYNAWASPLLLISTSVILLTYAGKLKNVLYILLIVSSFLTTKLETSVINSRYTYFTPLAEKVLENFPGLYNPYPYTFISRIMHVDGGYSLPGKPIFFISGNKKVKKILVPRGTANQVMDSLYGEGAADIGKRLIDIERQNKEFSYININNNNVGFSTRYSLGDIIDFKADREGIIPYPYFISGLGGQEHSFIWSDGKSAVFKAIVGKANKNLQWNLQCDIVFSRTFTGEYPVPVLVYAGDRVLAEKQVSNTDKNWSFIIPSDVIKDGVVELRFEYPNAVSPQSLGLGNDARILAVAWSQMIIDIER